MIKVDGSRRHLRNLQHAERQHRLSRHASMPGAARAGVPLFQRDSFQAPTQTARRSSALALPQSPQLEGAVQQLVEAVRQLVALLKSVFGQLKGEPTASGGAPPAGGAAPTGGTSPVATPGPTAPATAEEQFRALIAADVKTARGTEATQADYDYWLPKLMGPNDSSLVTSGQMTATEYWHRRLLGWQAGGSDVAQFGPYAGDGEQHGPVPSADSVVPGIPPSGAAASTPVGGSGPVNPDGLTQDMLRRLITADVRLARGSDPTQEDFDYWTELLMGPCDSGFVTSGQMSGTEYWHRRMLGWQAGGADVARYGPYAGDGQEHGAVPSYAQMLAANP